MIDHLIEHNDPANTGSEGDFDERNIEQNKNEIASFLRLAQIYQSTGYVNKKTQDLIDANKRKSGRIDRKGKRWRVRSIPRTPWEKCTAWYRRTSSRPGHNHEIYALRQTVFDNYSINPIASTP
jgi:hypothetical protein